MCFAPQRRAIFRHRTFKKWPEPVSFLGFWLTNVLLATAACNFPTSELQKVVRTWCVLYILTWKCASRYSGVQFFHIWTSKSGPNLVCFVHFDLKMRFSLQRRAIFPHLNFKKWSEPGVFCTFWLTNVLLATAACNFSTSQLQKVVRACSVLYILTYKCASRYSGVQFFHVFSQQPPPHPPLYRGYFSTQPTHKSLKNTTFRDFANISRLWIFFLLTFAQLYLLSSDSTSLLCFFIFWLCYSALLFQLSVLSEVRLLNFLRQLGNELWPKFQIDEVKFSWSLTLCRSFSNFSIFSTNFPTVYGLNFSNFL